MLRKAADTTKSSGIFLKSTRLDLRNQAVKYLNLTVKYWFMSRIDVVELSFQGTWIDGYLPGIEKIKQLAQKYRDLDRDEQGIPMEYGFTQVNSAWSQMDYFASMASAIREKFDRENVPAKSRSALCFTWAAKVDKQPRNAKALPLYEEYLTDPRRDDYCHFITIHEECPIEEDCLRHLMQQLHFQSKPDNNYRNPERFKDSVHQILTDYVNIIAVPQQQVKDRLKLISDNVFFSFV